MLLDDSWEKHYFPGHYFYENIHTRFIAKHLCIKNESLAKTKWTFNENIDLEKQVVFFLYFEKF